MHLIHTSIALALALCLAGCSGNYKFDDDQYRPLGDPQVEKHSH